jgi:hypothetical protein
MVVPVRQARLSPGNQINFLTGLQRRIRCRFNILTVNRPRPFRAAGAAVGIGYDTTTGYSAARTSSRRRPRQHQHRRGPLDCRFRPTIGQHFVSGNENADGSNAATFDQGNNNALTLSVMM